MENSNRPGQPYDDTHLVDRIEQLEKWIKKQLDDLIMKFKEDSNDKGEAVERIQKQLSSIKKNVTQLGNFDDIYDKIDDVDLFGKQSQKDIDYLMEITQPEQV